MLGTTRCLESSVLLLMRLHQSSRSSVLQEEACLRLPQAQAPHQPPPCRSAPRPTPTGPALKYRYKCK